MRILLAMDSLILPQSPKYFALGLFVLKRAVETQEDLAGVEVEVLERSVLDPDYEALVVGGEHDIVGFSCQCWNLERSMELARRIKERRPNTTVVFGGHSAIYEKDRVLEQAPWVDAIATGEGEVAFPSLVRAVRDGSPLEGVPGICTRTKPQAPMLAPVAEPPLPFVKPLEQPLSEYYCMETMRGCAFECNYCTWWVGPRRVRYYSEEYHRANIRHALDSGYRKAWIMDAAINFADGPLERLARSVRAEDPGKNLKFWYFVQWSQFRDSQMPSFEALGADTIHIGLETSNKDLLASVRRPWDEAKVRHCVKSLSSIGRPVVDVILGMPGDTVDGFKRTLDFAASLDVNVLCFRLMLYPGSDFHRRREELGLKMRPGLMPYVAETPTFKADELDRITELVEQMSYFDPTSQRYFLYEPVDYWEGGKPVVAAFQK